MARIGEMLGWGDNPWYQLFDSNRSAVSGAARGAMANPRNPWAGASYGMQDGGQQDEQRALLAQEQKDRQDQINQTAEWLRQQGATDLADAVNAGMIDGSTAFRTWYDQQNSQPDITANQNDFLFAKSNGFEGTFEDWIRGDQRNPSLGTTIYTGRDAQGNVIPMQVSNDGTLVPTQLPEGINFDPGAMNAERAFGQKIGAGQGEAVVAAPEAIATAQRGLTQIQQLKQDPGLWWSVGGLGWTPNVPGNPQAGTISRIEQLQGASFLEAFESLKGGGQITEVEGTKATNAIARLQRSQSYEDFVQALNDLEEIINIGLQRAIRQSQGGNPLPQLGGGASNGGWQVLGVE